MAGMKLPTFDGHPIWSNTSSEEVFYGTQAAKKIQPGIQA